MKTRAFLDRVQEDEVITAIRQAESKTSGEIRVFVSHKEVQDALVAAQTQFERMKMQRTRDRNGVLIFVAPRTRQFAVVGDAGIHSRCGPEFWNEVASQMSERFQQGAFTAGIVHAIHRAGSLLAHHFPRRPDDENELPDQVMRD
jgi:uncharacterized membrane protein